MFSTTLFYFPISVTTRLLKLLRQRKPTTEKRGQALNVALMRKAASQQAASSRRRTGCQVNLGHSTTLGHVRQSCCTGTAVSVGLWALGRDTDVPTHSKGSCPKSDQPEELLEKCADISILHGCCSPSYYRMFTSPAARSCTCSPVCMHRAAFPPALHFTPSSTSNPASFLFEILQSAKDWAA